MKHIFFSSLCLVYLTLIHGISFSQQGNIWTFGVGAQVDFNSTTPVVGNSAISSYEGCASISDNSGNLIFYTDGITVWDNTNTIIPGTLNGHWSAAQSGIIVPEPGTTPGSSTDRYYIFSVPQFGTGKTHFSIYDATLNSISSLNTPLPDDLIAANTTEGITVARHCNGIDYWVITHEMGGVTTGRFKSYLVTNGGISAPVNSDIGPTVPYLAGFPPNNGINGCSYMKMSPSNNRLAFIVRQRSVNLFDFNPGTGVISNHVTVVNNPATTRHYYGVEFSPNSNVLYYTDMTVGLYAYNITTSVSRQLVTIPNPGSVNNLYGGLQLAPNGMIYMGKDGDTNMGNLNQTSLGRINTPDSYLGSTYTQNGLPLAPGTAVKCGLPNIIPSLITPQITISGDSSLCLGESTTLIASGGTNYTWSPATGLNTTTGSTVTATPTSTQTYTVTSIVNGCTTTQQIIVEVLTPASLSISGIDTICIGDSTILTASGGTTYSWSPSTGLNTTTGPIVIANPVSNQTYTVTGTSANGCIATGQITVVAENCCFAASSAAFTTINSDPYYTNHTVLSGKYYVAPGVVITVDATTLDMTNVDIVFDECAGIRFVNAAQVMAYNSVFRPCDETKSWLGFSFSSSSGNISESTFKNAQKAIRLEKTSSVRITNNNFLNNQISIYINDNTLSEAISGNEFTSNNLVVDYQKCNNTYGNSDAFGIWARRGVFRDVISQNNFVNSDFNSTKRVYGIYLTDASVNANISSNTFTNQFTSIYVSQSSRLTVQNNMAEWTALYTYPGVAGQDIQFYFLRTNNSTITGNILKGKPSYSNYGIFLDETTRMYLNGNDLHHFRNCMLTTNSSNVEIINNLLENTGVGIHSFNSQNSYFGCNVINCFEDNSTGIIFAQNLGGITSCRIVGNCIYNTYTSISLNKTTGGGTNTIPFLANNFLYSYRYAGIINTNFTGNIGSGLTGTTAGKNSFSSNNVAGGSLDLSSNTPITSFGNYGITNISTNVTLIGNNTFYSTAACSNQLGNALTQFSPNDLCQVSGGQASKEFVSENGILLSEFETRINQLGKEEKILVLKSIANEIASVTSTNDMMRIHNLVLETDFSENDKLFILSELYIEQPAASAAYLESVQGMEDLVNIEKINLLTLTTPMTNEQANELMIIQESASENREQAREALNAYGGRYPYRLEQKLGIDTGEGQNELISASQNNLSIFPNPAKDMVSLQVSLPFNTSSTLIVTDLSGKVILNKEIIEDFREIHLDVSAFRNGMYIVSIVQQDKLILTNRLCILHQ